MRHGLAAGVGVALLVVAGACQGAADAGAPPDLSRPPAVQSTMWSLAVHTNAIATLLANPPLAGEGLTQLKGRVDDVAKLAAGLGIDNDARRHPLVKKGLGDFQKRVTAAQAGLAQDPPNLASVDAMISSCRECHARGLPPKPQFTL